MKATHWQTSPASLPYQAKDQYGRVGPHYVTHVVRRKSGVKAAVYNLDFVHLGGVGEDVCELSVNCGWGFSSVGFQPRQCNISVGQPQHEVRRFRYVSNFCTKSSTMV